MAIDKKLQIFDDEGNPVDYDILASDVKFLPDGKDLPTKLAEMETQIGEGGYTPPEGGIPKDDLADDVQESLGKADTALQAVDKAQLQSAINAVQTALNNLMNGQNVTDAIDTFNEVVDFLNGIDTDDPKLFNQLKSLSDAITALQTTLSSKANDNAVVKSVTINGSTQTPQNGNVSFTLAGGQDGDDGVGFDSVTSAQDGTMVITLSNGDTMTIDLKHNHPQYLKYELLADEAAYTALATKDSGTLYLIPES